MLKKALTRRHETQTSFGTKNLSAGRRGTKVYDKGGSAFTFNNKDEVKEEDSLGTNSSLSRTSRK